MRSSSLRFLAATLLWCACWCGSAAGGEAPPLPSLTAGGSKPVALDGASRYWIDERGDRTIEQVETAGDALPWRPLQKDQQFRLDGKALWVRFDARAAEHAAYFLEVASPSTDLAQLFHRDRAGKWVRQQAGEALAVSAWPVPGRVPAFELAADVATPTRYHLRIEHGRADFVPQLAVYRDTALLARRAQEQLLFGAYFGLAGLIAVAALVLGVAWRDRSFLAFSLYAAFLALGQLARVGVGAQHLWPDWQFWNDAAGAAWPGLPTAAALWFIKVVTEPARLSRALDLGVWALVAALLGAVALDMAIATRLSMFLVLLLTGLSLAAILSMVVWGWLDGRDRHLRLVALAFVPMVVVALFPLARGLGLAPVSTWTRYGLFYGTVLQLPLLFYALHVRSMAARESQLRTAALSRTDALTGLPHRRGLLQRLETSLTRSRGLKQPCALLGVRVSNLDAIIEEFGRNAAEQALVVAGSHLRRAIDDIDMAARVGEREFAVLLECPTTTEIVASRAQQIVASGLRQIDALPAALTLKFHVAVALLPHRDLDASATLEWVMEGLDQITPDARKLIKPLNL
ncbi:MAG: diguanylate cyclase [Ramlibacter sp.]|jgi:diguanylate cyclase (GGDEF)-like protein|uniref:sensor domain-containing diguanylate cyclase n=1 Tax=Ramlibacter sp. TaxID=1917967 RepID=UPI0026132BC1|nr:7TM diverse intracellular signaling domain-containing protein [Ramlibacter sp.]MDB5752202.1 diguanylate cyclase [Ramlibacter sp.]